MNQKYVKYINAYANKILNINYIYYRICMRKIKFIGRDENEKMYFFR